MNKENVFLDLSKLNEEKQKHILSLMPSEPHRDAYNIFRGYTYLHFIPKSKYQQKEKWMVDRKVFDKTELTYPEFIKVFEGGESDGWIKIESEADLPKEDIPCYFILKSNKAMIAGRFYHGFFEYASRYYDHNDVTHYQPIIKPLPPKL